ncbi:MAG: hypothetical protein ACP5F6_03930 [Microbacter sp.]
MTVNEFTSWMEHPESLKETEVVALRELCEVYPYFPIARMLLLKSLQNTNDVRLEREIRRTATYCVDRRKLYFLLFPEKKLRFEAHPDPQPLIYNAFGSDYFAAETVGSPLPAEESLKSLAQKLKEARKKAKEAIHEQPASDHVAQPHSAPMETDLYTEETAKQCIRDKQFEKALQILQQLYLKIPEKSVYFADQIRFIEKILASTHKS